MSCLGKMLCQEYTKNVRGCVFLFRDVWKMRKLKIMSDDVPMASGDLLGVNDLQDGVKAFCKAEGLDAPRFWIFPPDGYYICHAISLHLNGKDGRNEYDANVVFVLKDFSARENRDMEANRLRCMFADFGEPIVLISKIAERADNQHLFFKSLGLSRVPVTWSDHHQNGYEVYMKGELEKSSFMNLMERVGNIGKFIFSRSTK